MKYIIQKTYGPHHSQAGKQAWLLSDSTSMMMWAFERHLASSFDKQLAQTLLKEAKRIRPDDSYELIKEITGEEEA